MEQSINSVNTIPKVVTPNVSNVAVSTEKVIAQKVELKAANTVLQPETGYVVPEELKSGQAQVAQIIEDKVSELNDFVQNIQRGIQFSVHDETGRSIVTVTDKESGEVIRSFPSEQVLAIAAHIAESKAQSEDVVGLLFSESS